MFLRWNPTDDEVRRGGNKTESKVCAVIIILAESADCLIAVLCPFALVLEEKGKAGRGSRLSSFESDIFFLVPFWESEAPKKRKYGRHDQEGTESSPRVCV